MKCIYLGGLAGVDSLVEFVRDQKGSILLYESRDAHVKNVGFKKLEKTYRTFCIDDLTNIANESVRDTEKDVDRESIIRAVSNDSRLQQLKSRDQRIDFSGAFATVCKCNDLIERAIEFYECNHPSETYCGYSPHTIESFVFMRTMEECNVKVIKLINSPLPWIFLPMEGLSNESQVYVRTVESKNLEAQRVKVDEYFSVLKGEYEQAIPYYDRSPKISFVKRLMSYWNSLSPKSLVREYEKKIGYKEFKDSIIPHEITASYGVYFLHYQPESNTLPDAEIYNDQYLAIKKISSSLPDGMILVLKEHPSTFAKRCDLRFRPKGFYKRLVSLPNVAMCPLDTPTFDLIDSAAFVSSITGVCLTEALARGVPIIFFNSARFTEFPENVVIDGSKETLERLSVAILKIVSPSFTFPHDDVTDSFIDLVTYGYDGSDKDFFILTSVAQELRVTEKVNLEMMHDFFRETIRCSKLVL